HQHSPTETHTLSLHDALPILVAEHVTGTRAFLAWQQSPHAGQPGFAAGRGLRIGSCALEQAFERGAPGLEVQARHGRAVARDQSDRKSTRLNSSHVKISYAVF